MAETAVRAEFFKEAVLLGAETEKQGRPIYRDMDHVKIQVAGSREEVVRLVEAADKTRFPDQWRRYTDSNAEIKDGTPIKLWPPVTPSLVRHFENFNIFTVEQLSGLSDSNAAQMGPGTGEWVDKAKTWLADASNGAEALARVDEIKRLREQVEGLQATITAMGAEKTEPDTPPRKTRGAA